jgi:hypothetical protein
MKRHLAASLLLAGFLTGVSPAQAIRDNAGFRANSVPRNDDGSSALEPLGFTINFFGKLRTHGYVNNNGNVTFDSSLSTFTPFGLESTQREIVAAFFADVDTRPQGSKLVTYGQDMVDGRRAFGVNYIDVGYYNVRADKLNSFQIVLIERADAGTGSFDIEFNYQRINWETGEASGGVGGYGGTSAAVGWSNGSGDPGTSFELDGSLAPGSFLDGSRRSLIRNRLNSAIPGRYIFRARNGQILPPLTITTGCPLPPAFAGSPYALRFSAVGGAEYRWAMVPDPGASLPAGFTLTENGTLSGTPPAPGTSEFTLRLTSRTEDGEESMSKRCSLSVQPPTLNITSACPLPQATVGSPYSRTLQVSGGRAPFNWKLAEGSTPLPVGLSLSRAGVISGLPAAAGTAIVTLQVSSNPAEEAAPALKTCALTVNPAVLDLTSACSLPPATSGVPYSQQLIVAGGAAPYQWSAIGSLPDGLTLSSDGAIEGMPAGTGAMTFYARVQDARGTIREQRCAIQVDAPSVEVQSACPLPQGTAGQAYSHRLAAAGGTAPYSWSVLGSLPAGLTLSGEGTLSGSPGASGNFGFRFMVTDANGKSTTKGCTLQVARSDYGLTSCPLPNATAGLDYSTTLRASGGIAPYFFSSPTTFPAGLTMNSSGLVWGRPRATGTFPLTMRVMDSTGRVSIQPCQVTINPSQLQISGSCPLPEAKIGTAYRQQFSASGGSGPYTFSVDGRLPNGLTLSSDGVLSGTPLAAADLDFEIEARDSLGRSVAKACKLVTKLPQLPDLSFSSIPATMNPASTGPSFTVTLSQPYSLPIQGELVLISEADTGSADNPINRPDPRVRFSTGQRVLPFTIPAGSRQISAQIASTGTVAGATTIKLDRVRASGVPIYTLPSPRQFRVPRTAPSITDACLAPVAGGLNLMITGFSTTRQLTNATVTLVTVEGGSERTFSIDVSGSAYDYFSTDESVRNGGAFTLTIPVSIQGGEVSGGSLELSNGTGAAAVRAVGRCR